MPLTRKQQLVLTALREAGAPLGAYALLERLRGDGFGAPAQVYRALAALIEAGCVRRLETLNAYAPRPVPDESVEAGVAGAHDAPAVVTICDGCGRIDEYVDAPLLRRLGGLAAAHAFSPSRTSIEIHGRCGACAAPGET
ncbi:Fur family transcriptional regulator [Burkholderia perseverans]|uniref:Fur family transcriptional regulator n=1 Tax=Burkholderia perseverans TaxID=2615214 RepID=UPI001FED9F4E|nr:Fur family transcriptional regulator [Burkholderia perseverans]